jgi:hypothetical protein
VAQLFSLGVITRVLFMKLPKFIWMPMLSLLGLCFCALIALGISHWTSFPFWPAFGLLVFVGLVNGFMMDYEDRQPGGWNNPLPPDKEQSKEKVDDAKPDA